MLAPHVRWVFVARGDLVRSVDDPTLNATYFSGHATFLAGANVRVSADVVRSDVASVSLSSVPVTTTFALALDAAF
jgi:hypothetical protein